MSKIEVNIWKSEQDREVLFLWEKIRKSEVYEENG